METTLQEQLDRLDEAREAEADPGLRGRTPAHCSLPRVDRGTRYHFVQQNGPFNLVMSAGIQEKLTYVNLPRLLLVRVCTEVARTGQRNLDLGKRLSGFMDQLGICSTSGYGRCGPRERMERLLSCAISLHYRGDGKSVRLARAALHHRARAAHPPPHARADPSGRKPGACPLRLYVSTALLRFSQGDRWPSSLPKSLSSTILRSGLWLPSAARLALGPLGRRNPAARTLTLAQRGRLSTCLAHAALKRPCTWLRFVLPLPGLAVAASPG